MSIAGTDANPIQEIQLLDQQLITLSEKGHLKIFQLQNSSGQQVKESVVDQSITLSNLEPLVGLEFLPLHFTAFPSPQCEECEYTGLSHLFLLHSSYSK